MIKGLETFKFSSGNGSYTMGESMQSAVWIDFLKKLIENKFNLPRKFPASELVLLFVRLIQKDCKIADTSTINTIVNMYAIQNESSIKLHFSKDDYALNAIKLFVNWRKNESSGELERAEYYYNILDDPKAHPSIMYSFFKPNCTIHSKVQKIFDIRHVWDNGRIKRLFFMLVFKFSKVRTKAVDYKTPLESRSFRKSDSKSIVYRQASNGLWDYIEFVEKLTELSPNKRRKTDFVHTKDDLFKSWIQWMEDREDSYSEFLNFKEKHKDNQRKFVQIAIFREFMTIYFKSSKLLLK